MSFEDVIASIMRHISENKLSDALEQFRKLVVEKNKTDNFESSIVLLEGRLSKFLEEEINGLNLHSKATAEINQIRYDLVGLINQFKKDIYSDMESGSSSINQVEKAVHPLHQYPRGPMVETYKVPNSIKKAYAATISPFNAQSIVSAANAFRMEADPKDRRATVIRPYDLPPPQGIAPYVYWQYVFTEACLHGPRMLAALLLVVPDEQFPEDTRKARLLLLEEIKKKPF